MTSGMETIVLLTELTIAFGIIGVIAFLGLVWVLRHLRSFGGCLRCGCELRNPGGHCLMCDDPLRRQRSLPRGRGPVNEPVGEPGCAVEFPSYP